MSTNENAAMTYEELQARVLVLEQQNAELNARLNFFQEQFNLHRQKLYGRSSEQDVLPEQLSLFNEAEDTANAKAEEPTIEAITYTRRKRRAGQLEDKIKDLPVEVIDHEIPEAERICPCCQGPLHEMRTQVRREIKYKPAAFSVVEHHQHLYACRHCEQQADGAQIKPTIIKAAMPRPFLPGTLASSSLLAHICDQKYTCHQPLYRQEQHFQRLGLDLSRQTMANWIISSVPAGLDQIYHHLHRQLLGRSIIQADETTLQVLREPGRSADTTSYMWMYRSAVRDGPPIILYEYQTTRAGKHPQKFLANFHGYIQSDGYAAYGMLSNVIQVGCLAHHRRGFVDALKAMPGDSKDKMTAAGRGLEYCDRLFAIEQTLAGLSDQERFEQRLVQSKPVLDEFHAWLKQMRAQVLPKSLLGKAVTYCLNQWTFLCNFLLNGQLEISNNVGERAIRPFVIGRRNWLFSNTPKGASSSAVIFSLVETAKANNCKPFDYLQFLFNQLPNVERNDPSVLEQLMPWSLALPDDCRVGQKSQSQSPTP